MTSATLPRFSKLRCLVPCDGGRGAAARIVQLGEGYCSYDFFDKCVFPSRLARIPIPQLSPVVCATHRHVAPRAASAGRRDTATRSHHKEVAFP